MSGTIKAAISGGPEPPEDCEVRLFEESPSSSFLVRVCIPCLVCHQRLPQQLYAAAVGNDINLDSLERLVRIDRELVHLPSVRALRQRLEPFQRKEFDLIMGKAGMGPPQSLARSQVKTAVGGFLSYVADLFGQSVTRPQLNRLFDIAWEVEPKGRDADFADIQPGSFSRNIRRSMKKWEHLLADNEIREAVSEMRERAA